MTLAEVNHLDAPLLRGIVPMEHVGLDALSHAVRLRPFFNTAGPLEAAALVSGASANRKL